MAYDFPANPVAGQEYVPPMGGQTYVWYSPRWLVKGVPPAGGGVGVGVGIEEAPVNANQYARQNAAWTIVTPNPNWSTLAGKPATFPADPHVHTQADVTGLTAALTAKEAFVPLGTTLQFWRGDKTWQPIPAPEWTAILNKPATFTATAHIHPQSEVTNLVTDLQGKAAVSHTHAQADVTGLVAALSAKEAVVTSGTTSQFWRGDKTWQTVPGSDWSVVTNKPATFPPSTHAHPISDITALQTTLDTKSTIGHSHSYTTLSDIPNTFVPSAHIHSITDITDLAANLATKAPLANPIFTGIVTLPITNITGAMTGLGATFSGAVEASPTVQAKAGPTGNAHFWIRGPANEDRMVLYTAGATLGDTTLRVGGTHNFTFGTAGVFTAPGAVSTTHLLASGSLNVDGSAAIGGSLTVNSSITSEAGHVISKNYVYAQAGSHIGSATTAILGTASSSVGDVYLRPAGYNTSSMQTYVDGVTGNLIATGWVISNSGRLVGGSTTVVLCNNGTGAGTVYLRPNGSASGTGQMTVSSVGDVQVYRNLDTNGTMTANQNFTSATAALCLYCTSATGTIYLRPNNAATTEQAYYQYNGNFVIGNQGYKAVAGSWAAASDGRIKTVVGDYMAGLKEILQLKVRRYTYKGNETQLDAPKESGSAPYEDSPHRAQAKSGEVHISLIAQEAEAVMPDLVTRSTAWIDGVKVNDFRTLNPTNVTWALINAVQEMAAKIQTLEGEIRGYTTGTRRTEYPRLVG